MEAMSRITDHLYKDWHYVMRQVNAVCRYIRHLETELSSERTLLELYHSPDLNVAATPPSLGPLMLAL